MEHVAIDLGGRESQICIRDTNGTIVSESRCATGSLGRFLGKRGPSRVILETSAEAFRVADLALEAGHDVRVVPATLVKTLGVGARGIKTDRRDARVLSEVSCRIDLPSVHIPSEWSRRMKSVCGNRATLITARTKLVNNVRGWLRTQLWRVRIGYPPTFPDRLRTHARRRKESIPTHIERALQVIELLNVQIREASKELRALAKDHAVCRRLMTVPGVGPITAIRFAAVIDRVERFPSAHFVQSYLGLTPGERSSSATKRRTGITKAGPRGLRCSLVQGAWSAIRFRPNDPMVRWAKQVAERRGRKTAVVALARKIAGVLYALWRDGTTYEANRSAN